LDLCDECLKVLEKAIKEKIDFQYKKYRR
jgi:hypothetical protein